MDVLEERGVGTIAFGALAGGFLTGKYLNGVPEGTRRAREGWGDISDHDKEKLTKLNAVAQNRGQSLAQMAISWVLKDDRITSALIGASSVKQIEENVKAAENTVFTEEEIKAIDEACK